MIEDEHRGPLRPEVLFARHVEPHSGERQGEVGPDRRGHVAGHPATAVEEADARTDECGRRHAGQGGACSYERPQARSGPGREAGDGPVTVGRNALEARLRIERARPADQLEKRHVLVAVAVPVAASELDAARFGELAHDIRLTFSPPHGTHELAGKDAVRDLDLGAEDLVYQQLGRERCDLVARRR